MWWQVMNCGGAFDENKVSPALSPTSRGSLFLFFCKLIIQNDFRWFTWVNIIFKHVCVCVWMYIRKTYNVFTY